MIACNDVSRADIGFASDENAMTVFFAESYHMKKRELEKASKQEISQQLVEAISDPTHAFSCDSFQQRKLSSHSHQKQTQYQHVIHRYGYCGNNRRSGKTSIYGGLCSRNAKC
jgi:hypothetical protein